MPKTAETTEPIEGQAQDRAGRLELSDYWALAAAFIVKVLLLAWLAWHALPVPDGDTVFFKEPAYVGLHAHHLAIPTAEGWLPHAAAIYSAYPPLYTYVNLVTFGVFGVSLYSSTALDLGLHLIASALVALWLFRMTKSQWIAAGALLGSTFLLLPIGRPEELACILGFIALDNYKRPYLAAILLGLCLAASLATGMVAGIWLLGIFYMRSAGAREWARTALALSAISGLTLALVWLPLLAMNFPAAVEQFVVHLHTRFKAPLQSMLFGPFTPLLVVSGAVTVGGFLIMARRAQRETAERMPFGLNPVMLPKFVIAVSLLSFAGHIVTTSPQYQMRFLCYLLLAFACWTGWRLSRSALRSTSLGSYAVLSVALIVSNVRLAQWSLAPLTWSHDAGYEGAQRLVRDIVPANASVGGDGPLWTTINDGRPWIAIRWIGDNYWPDYIVSTNWFGPKHGSYILNTKRWADRIAREYVEVPVPGQRRVSAAVVRLPGGVRVPVSNSELSWHIRVWKKRALE